MSYCVSHTPLRVRLANSVAYISGQLEIANSIIKHGIAPPFQGQNAHWRNYKPKVPHTIPDKTPRPKLEAHPLRADHLIQYIPS